MRLSVPLLLLVLPALAGTFNLNWYVVDYKINVTPITINNTRIYLSYIIPTAIKGYFVGNVYSGMSMICLSASGPTLAKVIVIADIEGKPDEALASITFLVPGKGTACQPLPALSQMTELVEGSPLSKLLSLGSFMKSLFAMAASTTVPPISFVSSLVSIYKLLTHVRGLLVDVIVNDTFVGHYWEVKLADSNCLDVEPITPLPLVPGTAAEVKVTNKCSEALTVYASLDVASGSDVDLGYFNIKPNETEVITIKFYDPYKKFWRIERFARDVYFYGEGVTYASLPVFDVAYFLAHNAFATWYDLKGRAIESVGEGEYVACLNLPKALPAVELNQKVTLRVVEDKALARDVTVAERTVYVRSLEDLNGLCVSFVSEIHWNTRGYKLVVDVAGASVAVGEVYAR